MAGSINGIGRGGQIVTLPPLLTMPAGSGFIGAYKPISAGNVVTQPENSSLSSNSPFRSPTLPTYPLATPVINNIQYNGNYLAYTGQGSRPSVSVLVNVNGTPNLETGWVSIAGPGTTISNALISNGLAYDCHWDPTGTYLAVATNLSPYLFVFQLNGSGAGSYFTQLSNPATIPTGTTTTVRWSPNGQYLAVGGSGSPFINVYSFSGGTLTKLANPATLPSAAITSLSWRSDSAQLALGSGTTPFIYTYAVSGTTLTLNTQPATIPATGVTAVIYNNSGNTLFAANATGFNRYYTTANTITSITPGVTFSGGIFNLSINSTDTRLIGTGGTFMNQYTISGNTMTSYSPTTNWSSSTYNQNIYATTFSNSNAYLTSIHSGYPYLTVSNVATTTTNNYVWPTNRGNIVIPVATQSSTFSHSKFNPAGNIIVVGSTTASPINMFGRVGDSFIPIAASNTAITTSSSVIGIDFNPSGNLMAIADGSTGSKPTTYLGLYYITPNANAAQTNFTTITSAVTTPGAQPNDIKFSPDGNTLAVATGLSPYINLYTIGYNGAASTFTKLSNPASLPAGQVLTCAWSADSTLLACGTNTIGNYLKVYSVSGTTYTALTISSLPTKGVYSLAFSPDRNWLVVGYNGAPNYFILYNILSGNNFVAQTLTIDSNPGFVSSYIKWSSDSKAFMTYIAQQTTGTNYPFNAYYVKTTAANTVTLERTTITSDYENYISGAAVNLTNKADIYDDGSFKITG